MGRNTKGQISFDSCRFVQAVITQDGSISTFHIFADNEVNIIAHQQTMGIYISARRLHPSGDEFYALDLNWPENGGGILSDQY